MVKVLVNKVTNTNRKFWQIWKPRFVDIKPVTKCMSGVFSEVVKVPIFEIQAKTFLLTSLLEKISNPYRKWFQFWKPRMIPNPDYNPDPVEFDIVREKRPCRLFTGDA